MGDVPDQLVAAAADDAHRVVHRHFVERVRGVDFVPAGGFSCSRIGRNERPWNVIALAVLDAGEIEDRGRDVDPAHDRLADDAAFFGLRISHDAGQSQAGLVGGGLRAGERHAVVGDVDDQRVVVLAGLFENLDQRPKPASAREIDS